MLNGDFFGELRTLVDCGMFILIWMVQLIVYPSFRHISDQALSSWHRTYTRRIGYFVMPMMLAQLILSLLACIHTMTARTAFDLGLVMATWVLTAWLSVPLHKALAAGSVAPNIRRSLVRTNLPRALVWTVIFFFGLFNLESP
jgi:hypothetical protein